jgi:hypothetical protein
MRTLWRHLSTFDDQTEGATRPGGYHRLTHRLQALLMNPSAMDSPSCTLVAELGLLAEFALQA